MWSLGEVEHEDLVSNSLTNGTRQLHRWFLEFLGVEDRTHGYRSRLGVRNLDTDGALARDRRNDTNAQSRQRQGNVVLQVTDAWDTHAWGWSNLVKRDGRTYRSLDAADFYAEVAQYVDNAVFVGVLLVHVDERLTVTLILLQQVEFRIAVVLQVALRVVGSRYVTIVACHILTVSRFLLFRLLNDKLGVVRILSRLVGLLVWVVDNIVCLVIFFLVVSKVEDDFFGFRIVIDAIGVHVVAAIIRLFAVTTAHIDGHGNLLQIVQRIHDLTQDNDRLHAQIGEEGYSRQGQNSRQTWGADKAFYLLTNGQTVVSAWIEAGIFKEWREELCSSDGSPYHDDGQTHKPL